jgi:hypothetical protein
MRLVKYALFLIPIFLVVLAVFAVAAPNQLGVSDSYRVNFSEKVRVADALLPQGNYEIRHVMEGSDHIMVFRQLGVRKAIEVRVKCTLVPLTAKAPGDQKIYELNAANERVLHEMVFKGDLAKHVF